MGAVSLVSCVSVFFNRAAYVAESVGSLIGQTLDDLDILVVDDGSTDNTPEQLSRISDPRYRFLVQNNSGFTVTVNRAIRMTTSKYVAIHGSGDVSYPERMRRQVEFLETNPDVGVVGCRLRAGDKLLGPADDVERGPLAETARRRNPFTHGEVMFRRDLFDRVNGYREIFRFAQDRDLWLRLGRHCDYAVIPDVLYERRYIEGSVSRSPGPLILQKRLSRFAIQNDDHFRQHGYDLLDRYGSAALLMYRPSKATASKLLVEGLRWLRDGRAGADELLAAAWAEHKGFGTFLGRIASTSDASTMRASIIRALLARLPQQHLGEPLT